jgi:hypothetical protein
MYRILGTILLLCIIFTYFLLRKSDNSYQEFQKLTSPIIVVSIDHSCPDSASFGSVKLSGGNNLTLPFSGASKVAESVRRRYIEGDTIKEIYEK